MDLIRRDAQFKKIEVIKKPKFECYTGLYGSSSNEFKLVLNDNQNLLNIGDLVGYDTSEFGGKILRRIPDTANKTVTYEGKTFRGQMEQSIVAPFGVLSLSGTLNEIATQLFELSQLGYSIAAYSSTAVKTLVVPVGSNLLKAMDLLLLSFGCKMFFKISDAGVQVFFDAVNIKSFDSSQTDVVIDENHLLPTALHAIGKVNDDMYSASVFLQSDGSVGTKRYYSDMNASEIWQSINDNCENEEQFYNLISDKLLALRKTGNKSSVLVKIEQADIGDIIKISVGKTNISAFQTVSERTLKMSNNNTLFSFKMGG